MKKITRRAFALLMAVLMVTGLALNVSAQSYYNEYSHEANNRPHTHYAIASCTTSKASAETASDYSGEYTQTYLNVTVRRPGNIIEEGYDETSALQKGSSSLTYTYGAILRCKTKHFLDGVQFYGTTLQAE